MNVPNRYKGFSKLPENVQQRMDPSLAKKYQMGGSVMQRPLFRQMGGPAQMMPQDMPPPPMGGAPMAPPPMPPPPMDPMAEQMMAAESMGQSAGEDVANAMMMQIDGAEDYESLIDGIRGNELPLDARYQELAGFVGEADAMATPESVLAMTQPTIMMTEQGAVDSGIGELMQGIAGEVDMSGPMDDGVGSLMAAGAGNTPPVNFRNGGPVEVRGYAGETPGGTPTGEVRVGGGAPLSIIEQAKLNAPAYQAYLSSAMDSKARAADLEEQKRMSQAQMLFDIAGAGLAFAGETQGGTAAERLANALTRTQLTDKIGARSAGILDAKRAQAAEDRQLRMAGLQASLTQAQTDDASEKAMALALAKQKPASRNMQQVWRLDENGDPESLGELDINDRTPGGGFDRYQALTSLAGQKELGYKIYNSEAIKPFLAAQETALELEVKGLEKEFVTAIRDFDYTYPNGKVRKIFAQESFYMPKRDLENYAVQPFNVNTELQEIFSIDGKTTKALPKGSATLMKLLSGEDPEWTLDPTKFQKTIIKELELPRYKLEEITDKDGTRIVRINLDDPDDILDMATYDPMGEGKWFTFNFIGENGELVETVQDLSTKEGQALMEIVNKQNDPNRGGKLGSAGMLKIGTENLTPQSYITNDGNVVTSYDNRSFVDPSDGKVKQLTSAGAVALRDSNVYEIMKKSQVSMYAEKMLKDVLGVSDLDTVDTYTDNLGNPLPEKEQSELRKLIDKELKYLSGVKTTVEDIKKGTGFISNIFAALNNVGGSIAPETFNRIFKNTAEARASVDRFNVLAISALSVNPGLRVTNMEMDKIGPILPSSKRLITNTKSEAEKFQATINLLRQQRLILLRAITEGDPLFIGKDASKASIGKIRELNKILSLVRADKRDNSMTLKNALTATDEIED
jgi:hypothetical protein